MKTIGNKKMLGRYMTVSVLDHTDGNKSVMITCEGGNVRFQSNMSPSEARAMAGYLQDMANEIEEEQVIQYETDGAGV